VGERIFGCLDAEDHRPAAFDKNDLMVFETVADHIAQAVENVENLLRVNQLREELSRMIVHDLRNPLTVVHSALEMLDSKDFQLPETKKKQYLKTAKASCDELIVLLDSLLELEKIEKGKLELQREKLKPIDLIHPVVESLKIKAEIADKSLTFTVHDQMLIVEVDRRLFSRVLQNLVINALKYTKRGGHIHISSQFAPKPIVRRYLKTTETGLLLSVQDDGPGIPLGEEENIFNKFTTLKPHSPEIERGTGLGLTFCREVTNAHEGKIWVDSKIGKGSTFNVLLPLSLP
jgi:signal transduction histidine kinase